MKMGLAVVMALCASLASGVSVMSALKRNHLEASPKYFEDEAQRIAWNDCGGKGASASNKIRTLTAKLAGDPAPRHFMRNAAQDCMEAPTDSAPGKPYPGHNGFEPPATVFALVCADREESDCAKDDSCEFDAEEKKCVVNQAAHEYSRDTVYPQKENLYAQADLALGKAEEITDAGIVELKITGTDAGNDAGRTAKIASDFSDDQAKDTGVF